MSAPERIYDEKADRLFLVYYPLPPGQNQNKWGVTPRSIPRNIMSGINKPVIIYRKNPASPFHTHQAGNFVHPTIEEATHELGHPPMIKEYYQWQENKGVVGRIHDIDLRSNGYAFTYEITDPEAKQILLNDKYRDSYPGWTSPQIMTFYELYPEEERTGVFDHWEIAHAILTDRPAFGFDLASMKASCLGTEKECMIQTKSASSTENLGFCIKQATIDLLEGSSSHGMGSEDLTYKIMSENSNTPQAQVTKTPDSETLTYKVNNIPPETPKKEVSTAQEIEDQKTEQERNTPPGQEEPNRLSAKSLEEANVIIAKLQEVQTEQAKQLKVMGKKLEENEREKKFNHLLFLIPRDLFKSDEAHLKEVQKTMEEPISDERLIDYWNAKRELFALQRGQAQKQMEQPIAAKSASVHDIPDYTNSNTSQSTKPSRVQLEMELRDMVLSGGSR